MNRNTRFRDRLRLTAILLGALSLFALALPVQGATPLETAMQYLRNMPANLESLMAAFEVFFEVPRTELPSSAGFGAPDASHDPLPQPVTIVSAKEIPAEATDAIFDLRQSLRREFVKITGSGGTAMTPAHLQILMSMGKFPYTADADSYLAAHDVNKDGKLSIGEFVPSFEEVSKNANVKSITEAYLSGSGYAPGLVPNDTDGNRRRRRRNQGGP